MTELLEILSFWPTILFAFCAAGFREMMEHSRDDKWSPEFWGIKLAKHYLNTGTKGKGAAWKNKWKLDEFDSPIKAIKKPWYYLGLFRPENVERFPFSSTILVPFTDAEHLFQLFIELSFGFMAYDLTGSPYAFYACLLGSMILGFIKETLFPQVS